MRNVLREISDLSDHPPDELQGKSDNVGRAPGNQAKRKTLILKPAGAGFPPPQSAVEIPIEEAFLERAHFELALVGSAKWGPFGAPPQADAGNDPVPTTGEGFEHAAGLGRGGSLAELPAVDLAESIAGENQPTDTAGRDSLCFCSGEPQDVRFEGFLSFAPRSRRLCLVRGRDDVDLPAGLGGKLASTR